MNPLSPTGPTPPNGIPISPFAPHLSLEHAPIEGPITRYSPTETDTNVFASKGDKSSASPDNLLLSTDGYVTDIPRPEIGTVRLEPAGHTKATDYIIRAASAPNNDRVSGGSDGEDSGQVGGETGARGDSGSLGGGRPDVGEKAGRREVVAAELTPVPVVPEAYKEFVEEWFDDIITRPVGEDVDEYAQHAFQDLIDIVQDVQDTYERQPGIPAASMEDRGSLEYERRAMAYFGLDPYAIESALGHLEHISTLDGIIASITEHVSVVIVPPDRRAPMVPGGEKPFAERPHIPRLKTFLSSLETNFGIDLQDPNQCRVREGELDPGMMREESYKFVQLPTLQRVVLICDAAENATFVFDSSVLAGLPDGPTPDELMVMTKDQLRELIQSEPRVGYRLVYRGEYFVGHMSALMDSIPEATAQVVIDTADEQLPIKDTTASSEVDGSIVGTVKLADSFGATRRMVRKAIAELGNSLGELEKVDTRGSVRFSVAQQALVKQYMIENRMIVPEAPEDFASFSEIHKMFGAGPSATRTAIDECGDGLGDLLDARRGVKRTKYYSPDQQLQILEKLIENGSVAPRARPGYAPLTQIATANNLTNDTLAGILEEPEVADLVGTPTDMRFGSNTTGGYSSEQQERIAGILEARGLLRTGQPGDVNAKALPTRLTRHSEGQIKLARGALDGTSGFGTWHLSRIASGQTRARVYTEEQVGMLESWLNTHFPESKNE